MLGTTTIHAAGIEVLVTITIAITTEECVASVDLGPSTFRETVGISGAGAVRWMRVASFTKVRITFIITRLCPPETGSPCCGVREPLTIGDGGRLVYEEQCVGDGGDAWFLEFRCADARAERARYQWILLYMDVCDVLQATISFVHGSYLRADVSTHIDVCRTDVLANRPHTCIAVPLSVPITHKYLTEAERYLEIEVPLMFVISSLIILGQVARMVVVACSATTRMEECLTLLDDRILLWYLAYS